MDILEQIGITKEEMIDRIVEKALGITADYSQTGEESWEDIPFSKVIDDKITKAIGNVVDVAKVHIQERIQETVAEEVRKVFTLPFQPVNQWGEPKGELTTIRDTIAKEAIGYWNLKVDTNGTPSNYGTGVARSEWWAKKVIKDVYESELSNEVKKMVADVKANMPEAFAKELAETIAKRLK